MVHHHSAAPTQLLLHRDGDDGRSPIHSDCDNDEHGCDQEESDDDNGLAKGTKKVVTTPTTVTMMASCGAAMTMVNDDGVTTVTTIDKTNKCTVRGTAMGCYCCVN